MIYGIVLLLFLLIIFIGIAFLAYRMFLEVYPALHFGAIFVPSTEKQVESMINLADVTKDDRIIDLGSGDGRIVVAAAKKGAISVGVELNETLNKKARMRIRKQHLEKKAYILKKNMWDVDLSSYTVVFVYGAPYIMKKLEGKLKRELKKGARVVSNNYQFPTLRPKSSIGSVWLYYI